MVLGLLLLPLNTDYPRDFVFQLKMQFQQLKMLLIDFQGSDYRKL